MLHNICRLFTILGIALLGGALMSLFMIFGISNPASETSSITSMFTGASEEVPINNTSNAEDELTHIPLSMSILALLLLFSVLIIKKLEIFQE